MVFALLYRVYRIFAGHPKPKKADNALKFGILGAAKIAPLALIIPAKSHPEVIVQAVAARDKKKAEAFAKKHGIPQVFDSYDALLDDPAIDAVYIPLPNGLHFEWTLKALSKGKHVLLEKPSVSNSTEAELLFHSPVLTAPNAPILLEAVHYRFNPSWSLFLSLLSRPNIAHASAAMIIPKAIMAPDDIRFDYDLAGGAMTDVMYPLSFLRGVFAWDRPDECTACDVKTMPPPRDRCDYEFHARWKFPGGATAESHGSLQSTWREALAWPFVEVVHRPVVVEKGEEDYDEKKVSEGQVLTRTRKVLYKNPLVPAVWHRIDIEDEFTVREKVAGGEGPGTAAVEGPVVKKWTRKESKKAYTWKEAGKQFVGEPWWLSYRYQLEAFVDRIRGRPGSGIWVDAEDSIKQIEGMDMAYEKSGLGLRPTSKFSLPEAA